MVGKSNVSSIRYVLSFLIKCSISAEERIYYWVGKIPKVNKMLHISRICRMQASSVETQPHLEFPCELTEIPVGLCLGTQSLRFPDEAALIMNAWVLCYRSNQSVLTDGFPLPVRPISVESITDTHGQRLVI